MRVGVHTSEVEIVGGQAWRWRTHGGAHRLARRPRRGAPFRHNNHLLDGSGLSMEPHGEHELRGLSGRARSTRRGGSPSGRRVVQLIAAVGSEKRLRVCPKFPKTGRRVNLRGRRARRFDSIEPYKIDCLWGLMTVERPPRRPMGAVATRGPGAAPSRGPSFERVKATQGLGAAALLSAEVGSSTPRRGGVRLTMKRQKIPLLDWIAMRMYPVVATASEMADSYPCVDQSAIMNPSSSGCRTYL